MESFMKEFEHLKIPLKEILSATHNFNDANVIGRGGFGRVYRGELSHSKGRGVVVIKRLDRNHEFLNEIKVLNSHTHENLIALLGFCDEGDEKILVYEYASNGSLDGHLSSTDFKWTQRLKTCLDAARGLSYLHEAKGTKKTVIHRDIKSANILLDANWNAKVSDMGLSMIAPANQQRTFLVSNVAGTIGYLDPMYIKLGILTKESDVYSFGVVLFEVLCGKVCYVYSNGRFQVPMWKKSYEQNKLHEIILDDLKQEMDQSSLKTYSDIAYKCLQESREERPTMPDVVKELEAALTYQMLYEVKLPKDYKKMLLTAEDPLNDVSESELKMLLLKGILINRGKTWFSRNTNGEHCEMISIAECLTSNASESPCYICSPEYISRFSVGCYEPSGATFKTHVRTRYLSPKITYTVNLVFKRKRSKEQYIGLEYKLKGEKEKSYSFVSDEREDGWLTAELYQFTSDQENVDLEIQFYTKNCDNLLVESIEFRPIEKVEHEVLMGDKVDMQPISDTDTEAYWEQKLPIDYEEIINWCVKGVRWSTKKELYNILCEGFLINSGEEWFFLAKDGKKCFMLPAKTVLVKNEWTWNSEPETRFGQVADCISKKFDIFCNFGRSNLLSPKTTYATYLVYRLPNDYNDLNPPVQVVDKNSGSKEEYNLFLRTPQTPVISRNGKKEKTFNPSIRPNIKGLPKLRSDGWMEVQVHEFQTLPATIKMIFFSYDMSLAGITVQGLEFRPISDTDTETYWEEKLPSDYEDIIKRSKDSVKWETKKDLYSIFCKGFQLSYGEEWFFLAEDGKKCLMLPARSALEEDRWKWKPKPKTRFEEVAADCISEKFSIFCKFNSKMLSPQTTYATYLVYDLPDDYKSVDQLFRVRVVDKDSDCKEAYDIFLRTPQTPVISRIEMEQKNFNQLSRPNIKGVPKRRGDGWMEVQVYEFQTCATIRMISTHLKFSSYDLSLKGVIVQGLEFRPV